MNPSSVAAVRVFTVTVAVAVAAARLGPAFAQPPAAAIEQGKTVFEHYCAACHGTGRGDDGAPMLPGTHALQLKYRGEKPGLLEERTDLPAELIKVFVRNGVASMPPFRKTEVTDEDIEAIAAYLAAAAQVR
jgi:mono/diheme cytochrome c family protein